MSVVEFFTYLLGREPTRQLGFQLVEVYDERQLRRVGIARSR